MTENRTRTRAARLSIQPYAPSLLLLLFMLAASGHYSSLLPDPVPIRFGLDGNPVEHGSRAAALALLPAVYALDLLLFPLLVFFVTKDMSPKMQRIVGRANTAVGTLFAAIHVGSLLNAIHPSAGLLQPWIVGGLALFMMFIASVLGEVEPNRFIGVRTPWSLGSRRNWDATHKFASRVAALTGLLLFIANLLARPSLFLAVATMLFAMTIPVFYSLWHHQNLETPGTKPQA